MYTQCPECGAVYRITSAHLKQAAGEVQCGQCEARFDALDRLSDVFPKSASGPAPRMPLQQDQPESDQAEADQPESDQPPPPAEEETPQGEIAKEQREPESDDEPGDGEPTTDAAAESGEGAGERSDREGEPDDEEAAEEADDDALEREADGEEERSATDPESEEAGPEEHEPEDAGEPVPGDDDDEPTIDLDQTAEQLFAIEDLSDQVVPDLERLEFSEGLPLESDTDTTEVAEDAAAPPDELTGRRSGKFTRWAVRLLLVAVIAGLGAYLVHSQRGLLMRNPTIAPWLQTVYGRLGMTVETTWDVGRFRILDSSAELDAAGDLQVRLSFMNDGDFTQPYPVLRIVLEDRWGDEIGSRELPPANYLSGYVAGRGFRPSERATGRATVTEPGLVAVGFRLDLCLPAGTGRSLECLSEQP